MWKINNYVFLINRQENEFQKNRHPNKKKNECIVHDIGKNSKGTR